MALPSVYEIKKRIEALEQENLELVDLLSEVDALLRKIGFDQGIKSLKLALSIVAPKAVACENLNLLLA